MSIKPNSYKMNILIVGSVAVDDIKTPFGKKEKVLGGASSHFSVAASILSSVEIIGVIGNDFPKKYLNYLKNKGIETSGIQVSDKPTFRWKGHYEDDMSVAHTDETLLGAFENFDPILNDIQSKTPFIFLGNIDPVLQMKVVNQVKNPKFIGLDSMNFWIDSKVKDLWKVIKKVDILFLNDAEIRQLANEPNLIKAARKVQKKGPKYILVKKGEHGILVVGEDLTFVASAYPTETVKDPTGAGDSFAGGFVSFLASKYKSGKFSLTKELIKQAAVWGSAVASFAVEAFSTNGLDKLSRDKILERCKEIHNITTFNKHK